MFSISLKQHTFHFVSEDLSFDLLKNEYKKKGRKPYKEMIIASCFDTYDNMTKNKLFKETTNSVKLWS